jgi:hypothetical protein
MVNYDLPWNPNRLEQRFRPHPPHRPDRGLPPVEPGGRGDPRGRCLPQAAGQAGTGPPGARRPGLRRARQAQFEGRPLRDLLIEAIRYGDRPEVGPPHHRRWTTRSTAATCRTCWKSGAGPRRMDASRVQRIREDMERAEARACSPTTSSPSSWRHSSAWAARAQREPRRYEITHVPAPVRNRDRLIGIGEPVLPRYERIAFEKEPDRPPGPAAGRLRLPRPPAAGRGARPDPGAPPRSAARGAVLVDERDHGVEPRVLFYLEHAIQDASLTRTGERRVISKRMLYVELARTGHARHVHYAPYLDYRPAARGGARRGGHPRPAPSAPGSTASLEQRALGHAIAQVVPEHLAEVRDRKLASSPRPRRRSRTG